MAGTYRSRQEFLDRVINPTSVRLSTPIVPTMRGIWADGDMVIVLWDGEATARDGKPYRNPTFRRCDRKCCILKMT